MISTFFKPLPKPLPEPEPARGPGRPEGSKNRKKPGPAKRATAILPAPPACCSSNAALLKEKGFGLLLTLM
jgi:hypothetical protein